MSEDPVIELRGVSAGYDGEMVVDQVDLLVRSLDFIGIIGPNGGGKSTLIKVILGLLPAASGTVRVLGTTPGKARARIGYVPQSIEFDRHFPIRVWDVVRMGRLGVRGLFQRYTAEDDAIVDKSLRRMDALSFAHQPMGELSGGQRQRVLVARALATEPEILLLDEPTASVDPTIQVSIYEWLKELNERVTILLVTHDMGAISRHVKTVGCLNRRFHYHGDSELTPQVLEDVYQCPIDLIAHGAPHRVLSPHDAE